MKALLDESPVKRGANLLESSSKMIGILALAMSGDAFPKRISKPRTVRLNHT